jgi:RNA-binding protein
MPASPAPKLSGAALRKLRALGHSLTAVVAVGKDGLTDSVVAAVDSAIGTHELVKVKIQREAPVDRHEAGIELAARTGSVLAQVIGRTLLLYRRHPKKPKIDLKETRPKRTGGPAGKGSAKSVEKGADSDRDPGGNP